MIVEFAQSYQDAFQIIVIALGVIGLISILIAKKYAKEILLFLAGSEGIAFLLKLVLPPLTQYEWSMQVFFVDPSTVAFLDVAAIGAIFTGICYPILWVHDYMGSKRVRNLPGEWAGGACLVLGTLAAIPGIFANFVPITSGTSWAVLLLGAGCASMTGLWYGYKHSEKVEDWWENILARRVPSSYNKRGTQSRLPPSIASLPTYDPTKANMRAGDICLGRVRVTLGPSIDTNLNQPPHLPSDPPKQKTFMQDFLPVRDHPKIYGVEIARDNGHTWAFFARARDPEEAQSLAAGILQRLKTELTGLDGVADVVCVPKEYLAQRVSLIELRLPRPPFRKAALLDTLARLNPGNPFRVCIVFHKATQSDYENVRSRLDYGVPVDDAGPRTPHDSVELESAKQMVDAWKEDLFAARIFVQAEVATPAQERDLRGSLQEMLGHVENTRGFHARARNMTRLFSRVVSCAKQLDFDRFLATRVVDFDFPTSIRMSRGWVDDDEHFAPIEGLRDDSPEYLILGDALRNGATSGQKGAVVVNHLGMHTGIFGGTGKGKTRFLLYLLHKLRKDHHLPMVIINFAKKEHQLDFPHDRIFRFPSPDFELPYFVDPGLPAAERKKFLGMAGMNIAYMLGLAEWELVPMTFRYVLRTEKDPPKTLADLFTKVRAKLDRRQYSNKTQADIIASVENRMDELRDRAIVRCTQLLAPGHLPKWLELARAGKAVVLDISACENERALALLCILLAFYATMPILDKAHKDTMRVLLVADEVQDLIGTSASKDPKSAMYQIAARVGELFDTFLREFRERGVGVMLASQKIADLPKSAYDIPNLKILFQLDTESANYFSFSQQRAKILNELKAREAFVLNAHTGDRYYIRTPEFALPNESPATPETPAKTPEGGEVLQPELTSLVPCRPEKPKRESLKEIFQQVKRDRSILNPRLTRATTQSKFRARALRLSERGHHVAAFNVIYALWINAAVALLHKSGPITSNLRGLLRRIHRNAHPDTHLTSKELATFYAAGETAWHFLQQAKRGKLHPGDVQAFDIALERIFRDLEFCLSRIQQRKTESREVLPQKASHVKKPKRKGINRYETSIAPRKQLSPGPEQVLPNTPATDSRAFLRWFQDSLLQQDANGAYFAVFAYWVPKLCNLSANVIAVDQRRSLHALVETILADATSTSSDPSIGETPVAALLQDIQCLETQVQAGTLQDTGANVAAVRGLFFALKDLFIYCLGISRGASAVA